MKLSPARIRFLLLHLRETKERVRKNAAEEPTDEKKQRQFKAHFCRTPAQREKMKEIQEEGWFG